MTSVGSRGPSSEWLEQHAQFIEKARALVARCAETLEDKTDVVARDSLTEASQFTSDILNQKIVDLSGLMRQAESLNQELGFLSDELNRCTGKKKLRCQLLIYQKTKKLHNLENQINQEQFDLIKVIEKLAIASNLSKRNEDLDALDPKNGQKLPVVALPVMDPIRKQLKELGMHEFCLVVFEKGLVGDLDFLFEIGKIAAAQNGAAVSYYIQKYKDVGLSTEQIFKIGEIAAAQNGVVVSENIQKYKDAGLIPEQIFKIGKIAAAQNGEAVSEHIQKYKDAELSTEQIFKLGEIIAAQNGAAVSYNIQKYKDAGLSTEQIFKLGKIAAAQYGGGVSHSIQKYKTAGLSTDQIFELGKIAVVQDGAAVSYHIQKYKTAGLSTDQIFELGKIAAAQNGEGVLNYIQKYKDIGLIPEQIFEIGKIALSHMFMQMQTFPTDRDIGVLQAVTNIFPNLQPFLDILIEAKQLSILLEFANEGEEQAARSALDNLSKKMIDLAHKKGIVDPSELQWFEKCRLKSTLQVQQQLIFWMGSLLVMCEYDPLFQPAMTDLATRKALTVAAHHPNLYTRVHATESLLSLYQEGTGRVQEWRDLAPETLPEHMVLTSLMLAKIDISQAIRQKVLKTFSPNAYQDAATFTDPFNECLYFLEKEKQLSRQEKDRILNLITEAKEEKQEKEPKTRLIVNIRNILSFGCGARLQEVTTAGDAERILGEVYKTEFGMGNVDNFAEKYQRTFLSFTRSPQAIITYAARLRMLPPDQKQIALKVFGKFIQAVLEGTFPAVRYEAASSSHLERLSQEKSELFTKFQEGLPSVLAPELLGTASSPLEMSSEYFQRFLKEKLLTDKHLGANFEKDYPTLAHCLKNPEEVQEEIHRLNGEIRGLPKDAQDRKLALSIEKYCLTLLKKGMEPKQIKPALDGLKNIFETQSVKPEFYNDVCSELDRLFPSTPAAKQKLLIKVSDNWQDLLMVGTDVQSCQRIEGDVRYNKCLLDYLMDGKIKVIAVVDENAGGVIRARSMVRLLLDQKTGQWVLFQERFYANKADPELSALVRKRCIDLAEHLGVPLVVNARDFPADVKYPVYPNSIDSLSSVAPFEYVDALGGIQEGPYSIANAHIVYSP